MPYTLIRAKRKTISIQVTDDLDVVVRAPRWVSRRQIDEVVRSKQAWINRRKRQMQDEKVRLQALGLKPFAQEELDALKCRAREVIPNKVEEFSKIIGVDYARVTIRAQKSRWGSCSAKGNLNFNCLIMLAPELVLDYLVVHELCHRKHMNHKADFWNEVGRACPNYKAAEAWLKGEGRMIMKRMR